MTSSAGPAPDRSGGRILVVDDHQPNRELLADILETQGYTVVLAGGGGEALDRIAAEVPDLVLLDVSMPEVDGLEVCRRLRADPATTSLPVILVTALTEREHRLEGIAAGANDYLTKPIDRADLLLRVRNALHLRRVHSELAAQYARLRRLEEFRDNLVHMVIHDLRTPLTGISGFLDLIKAGLKSSTYATLPADVEAMSQSVRQMTGMVNTLLDVSRLEADAMPLKPTRVDLGTLARTAIQTLGGVSHRARIRYDAPTAPVEARVDADLVVRVIANLVSNAVKYTPSGGEVLVEVTGVETEAVVRVSDTGPGIPVEDQARIFEKFAQATAPRDVTTRSSGLGLTFCKLAVEAHGGKIGVASEVGRGTTFWVSLPLER